MLPCTGNMCQLMAVIVVMLLIYNNNGTAIQTSTQQNHLFSLFALLFPGFVSSQSAFSYLFFFLHFFRTVLQVEVYFVNMPLKVFHFPLKYSNQMPTPATTCRVLILLSCLSLLFSPPLSCSLSLSIFCSVLLSPYSKVYVFAAFLVNLKVFRLLLLFFRFFIFSILFFFFFV